MTDFLPIVPHNGQHTELADALPPSARSAIRRTHSKISLRPSITAATLSTSRRSKWPCVHAKVHGVVVYRFEDGRLAWDSGARVDYSGCPLAFHPLNADGYAVPLSDEQFRGFPNIARKADGALAIQGGSDPAPGWLVSRTAYRRPGFETDDPRAYLDARTVPYVSVPLHVLLRAKVPVLGCVAVVRDKERNYQAAAVAGHVDLQGIGAMSAALFREMSINDAWDSGRPHGFEFTIFPGHAAEGYELQRWEK